jgi:hypothetical protein
LYGTAFRKERIGDRGNEHSDGATFLGAQTAGDPVGTVLEAFDRQQNPSRVGSEIPGFRLTTAETVWIETLATRATSVIVALRSELTWGMNVAIPD